MQNWLSNFHIFSFQSSNFLFLSIQGSVTASVTVADKPTKRHRFACGFFFFFKHVKGFAGVPAKPQCGAAGVKSHEIKLPRELISCQSLCRRRVGCRSVRLSLLWREIASLTFPHEIQQNSIPKYIIIILYIYIYLNSNK